MTPARVNIDIHTGYTFTLKIVCKDSAGEFVDLTGYTPYAEIRSGPGEAVIVDLSPSITDATGGEVTITLTDETTAALTAGNYHWDLMLENAVGARLGPYVAGRADVFASITAP